jgi:hypothetical protein
MNCTCWRPRYIEQHPVRAGLAATPWDYLWSRAAAHVAGSDDQLVTVAPLLTLVRSRYEMTCPSIFISLRLLMPFHELLRSSYSLTTA